MLKFVTCLLLSRHSKKGQVSSGREGEGKEREERGRGGRERREGGRGGGTCVSGGSLRHFSQDSVINDMTSILAWSNC